MLDYFDSARVGRQATECRRCLLGVNEEAYRSEHAAGQPDAWLRHECKHPVDELFELSSYCPVDLKLFTASTSSHRGDRGPV